VSSKLEDVEISVIVKDLATKEEKEIGIIKEKLQQSPKEYILSKLLGLPELSSIELPVLEKIVNKYLKLAGGKGRQINIENRTKVINNIYSQIKEKIGEKTEITYKKVDEKIDYTDYSAVLEKNCEKKNYDAWDDSDTKRGLVTGYNKTIFKENIFDSRQERLVSKILETDSEVIKWFRPYKKENFSIKYKYKGERPNYIPDFIAETKDRLYIIEPKAKKEIESDETKAKVIATLVWIREVNRTSKKKWEYLLIRHDRIVSAVGTFKNLKSQGENLDGFIKSMVTTKCK